jgi:hypothetical protein
MKLNVVGIFTNLFILIFFTIASLFEKSWHFYQLFGNLLRARGSIPSQLFASSLGCYPLLRPSKKSLTASDELKKLSRQKFFDRNWALGF